MKQNKANIKPIYEQRRRALAFTSSVLGVAAAESLVKDGLFIDLATAYTPRDNRLAAGDLFNQEQMQNLSAACAIVIPKTQTLGADEVDTQGFIDRLLTHCYGDDQRQQVTALLDDINVKAKSVFANNFHQLSEQDQFTLLSAYDAGQTKVKLETIDPQQIDSFKFLKSLIVIGYVTSEEGASNHLQYVFLAPNSFEADVPLAEFGRAASTVGFY